jgi:hypothetical protein
LLSFVLRARPVVGGPGPAMGGRLAAPPTAALTWIKRRTGVRLIHVNAAGAPPPDDWGQAGEPRMDGFERSRRQSAGLAGGTAAWRRRAAGAVLCCLLSAPAAAADAGLGTPLPAPSALQLERALERGQEFQRRMPSGAPAAAAPPQAIPPAYVTPPPPEPGRDAYYAPCYSYCLRYPGSRYCQPPGICAPYPDSRFRPDRRPRRP